MKRIIIVIVLALCSISCDTEDTYKTVIAQDYSIKVPSYLSEATDLNKDASLQYQHLFKELYIIVIHENKKDVASSLLDNATQDVHTTGFSDYVALLTTNLEGSIKMKNKTEKDTVINSLQAKIIKFEAKLEQYDVFYETAFVSGKDNYYQIMTWTLLDRKKEHEATMDKMVYSFQLKNRKNAYRGTK